MQFSDQEVQHIGKWKTLVHDDIELTLPVNLHRPVGRSPQL